VKRKRQETNGEEERRDSEWAATGGRSRHRVVSWNRWVTPEWPRWTDAHRPARGRL